MIPSVYRISLDVHDAHSSVCLDMKRQDTARQISIALTDGGFPYKISEECYAIFTATKADGHIIAHPCEIKGNIILYDVHAQTTAAVGLAECEIKLYGADDKLITSPGFNILVSSTSYTEGDIIESEDHVTVLGHLISQATTVIAEGKAVNAEARALIDDMNAKRTVLDQQIADTKEYAESANRAAANAVLARDRAEGAANLAVSNARQAETSASNAKASEDNAKASAHTAVNMANAAANHQSAAEKAASDAQLYAEDARRYAVNAKNMFGQASGCATAAANSAKAAKESEEAARRYAEEAAGGGGGLPLPPAAAVGQFIVVSAVDESGKVTATEAITLADAEGVGF
jgi:hypothetical protein